MELMQQLHNNLYTYADTLWDQCVPKMIEASKLGLCGIRITPTGENKDTAHMIVNHLAPRHLEFHFSIDENIFRHHCHVYVEWYTEIKSTQN